MSRPMKEGLDYFPHDVDLSKNDKINELEILYGNDGYAIYLKLLERIYKKGDNFRISDAETIQILSRNCNVSIERFTEILNKCLKLGLFSSVEYQKGILTSDEIKRRIKPVFEKRKKMQEKYDLGISDAETQQKLSRNDHSKVKKSKVKKSKVYKVKDIATGKKPPVALCFDFEAFWQIYPKRNGLKVGKQAALEEFKRQIKSQEDYDKLLNATQRYAIGNHFIRDAVRFLKQAYWKDWYIEPPEKCKCYLCGIEYPKKEMRYASAEKERKEMLCQGCYSKLELELLTSIEQEKMHTLYEALK